MNVHTRFRLLVGLALVLLIVVAASVSAHSPLPGAPDLPLRIIGEGERAALVPLPFPRQQWGGHPELVVPPPLAQPAPGSAQLLPNWEVGRNAVMLLPNYEPGTVMFELLNLGAISSLAPAMVPPSAAPIYADKP